MAESGTKVPPRRQEEELERIDFLLCVFAFFGKERFTPLDPEQPHDKGTKTCEKTKTDLLLFVLLRTPRGGTEKSVLRVVVSFRV
jgi:hypothetical protein